ncbi:BA75_02186T0 [Komagataella pastoris]|uniref:Transcription initiation factor TFIID subunit 2 n=1 Tax=Komagataella pastoris TaxID=4922 RepID=A0A1B2JD77_PICPA|nr:BA75_02186T0 [Komagataella pastoris]
MPAIPYDYPSIVSHGTPRKQKNQAKSARATQNFKVAHQKVQLDVDLATQTVNGETELTIFATDPSLSKVRLDARCMQIHEVSVNLIKANFIMNDFSRNDEFQNDPNNETLKRIHRYQKSYDTNSENIDINQHHFYRSKFNPLYLDLNNQESPESVETVNTENLTVYLPENLRLRPHDLSNTYSPVSNYNSPLTSNSALMNSDRLYTPFVLKINYSLRVPKNGIIFNGGSHTTIEKTQWFCHTINNDIGCSASSWMPCIDNFYEKNTWELQLIVPKTVGDIGQTKPIGETNSKQPNDDDDDDMIDSYQETDEEMTREIKVVLPDFESVKESPHILDHSKKIVSVQLYNNPVAAHHIGFFVGPFEQLPASTFKFQDQSHPKILDGEETSHDDFTSNVAARVYFLPSQKEMVLNTCLALYKNLDFYSKEFGSYPFSTYSMVFVDNLPTQYSSFAGISGISSEVLYDSGLVEPMFPVTELLSLIVAEQWSGINIVPKSLNDYWCVIGIAHFMAGQFLKKLFGFNNYKFVIKQRSDRICREDIGKAPLANQHFRFPVNDATDFKFIRLKAPLVLFILDRRMTKTDRSFGLSRVIPKIFLQAMSHDLYNGNCLSTSHFQHVCEKVAHHKLDSFFNNWVHNSGTPILRVTQRFNKKRMFIEMGIRQVQGYELARSDSSKFRKKDPVSFLNEACQHVDQTGPGVTSQIFTGPMTIRIHEADGTPYEHIVDLKEGFTKLDIQYNTKYKRIKKNKKDEELTKKDDSENTVNKLGDILSRSKEMQEWHLEDLSAEGEEARTQDAFEWIRIDADFEWICQIHLNQPDYMYQSQLQQDRDVEAQLDSVNFFSNSLRPNVFYSSVLVRTLMDNRYFYGVRCEAAKGLARLSKEENNHIGLHHLLKTLKQLFCYPMNDSHEDATTLINNPKNFLPLPNDFSDFQRLFIQETIPAALSTIKIKDSDLFLNLRRILLRLLQYNDNLNNDFNDCFYVCSLIRALANTIVEAGMVLQDHNEGISYYDEATSEEGTLDDRINNINRETVIEFNRRLQLDQWDVSYHTCISDTILNEKVRLGSEGLINFRFPELLQFTQEKYSVYVRLAGFRGLLLLGGLKNKSILHYFFSTAKLELSALFKRRLIDHFLEAVGVAALFGTPSTLDDPEFDRFEEELEHLRLSKNKDRNLSSGLETSKEVLNASNFVVEEGFSNKSRRDTYIRTTMKGAIQILKRDYAIGEGLTKELWSAVHSCLLSINIKRDIFDLIDLMYDAYDSYLVKIDSVSDKKVVTRVETVSDTTAIVKVYAKARPKPVIVNSTSKKSEEKPKIKLGFKKSTEKSTGLSLKIKPKNVAVPEKVTATKVKKEIEPPKDTGPSEKKVRLPPISLIDDVIAPAAKFEEISNHEPKKQLLVKFGYKTAYSRRFVRILLREKKLEFSSLPFDSMRYDVKFKYNKELLEERTRATIDQDLSSSSNSYPVSIDGKAANSGPINSLNDDLNLIPTDGVAELKPDAKQRRKRILKSTPKARQSTTIESDQDALISRSNKRQKSNLTLHNSKSEKEIGVNQTPEAGAQLPPKTKLKAKTKIKLKLKF